MLQTPSLERSACKVLHDGQFTLSHQGRVSGQDDRKFTEHIYCDRRKFENFFSPPVHATISAGRLRRNSELAPHFTAHL